MAAALIVLDRAKDEMRELVEQYFAQAYELGLIAADDVAGLDRAISLEGAARRLEQMIEEEFDYMDSWFKGVAKDIDSGLVSDYTDAAAVTVALTVAIDRKAWRSTSYSRTIHNITFKGFREEMVLQELALNAMQKQVEALFTSFPESDIVETSCDGCIGAVHSNPYHPANVPSPGDFECTFNCRHYIAYRVKLLENPVGG